MYAKKNETFTFPWELPVYKKIHYLQFNSHGILFFLEEDFIFETVYFFIEFYLLYVYAERNH